uniref:Retrotransposable element Tf2 n=1 Tax=Cajanus cajan TaxID=3821 RepID=A0A151S4U1_CAJCA|nr:Retrotransposable element Tf2 [Cajanus cajan]
MPGIDANFICHRLAIHKEAKPVAQRKRKVGGERREAIITETQKLLNAGFIREVRYTTWLANVVLVKKSLGKWRMCVDYTDLNKAYPKDSYPLPSIDRLPINKVFHQQIRRNMKVYVDDMVVKTTSVEDHAADLAEVFSQIRKHNMRLNPEKCVFSVQGGKFFGFMITSRGIEANLEKCKAIIQMQSPQTVKDVQRLTGRLVSMSQKQYQMIEKLALALVTAARRLRPYFQSHQVVIKTDYPIKQILRKQELARRMIAWSVKLSEFDIQYESRGALKAQCLANFVVELTPTSVEEPQSLKFGFKVTNNQAEYEALLAGLRLAHDLGARKVSCNSDSKLMISSFDEFAIQHIPREQNTRADLLSKPASTKRPGHHRTIIQEILHSPSLDDKVVNTSDNEERGWMTGIWNYLKSGTLPEDKDEARKMRVKLAKFAIVGDELFKRGISTPLLKCLTTPQVAYVIEEIHRGICSMHSGARLMAARVLRAGYYWPTLKSDCQAYVQKCKECQQFGNTHRQPPEALHQMMWGMDILGPFPPAKGQLKFLLVAIDYFTKWIEACPLTKITTDNVQKFSWKNIICRFGIPHSLVTDNGRQFIAQSFEDFLRELDIKHLPTSVEHPQTNGWAEAANKVILRELKKRLGNVKGQWANELPSILWAYHCTPQSTTQETPYRLTYEADAMIPVEIGETSHRCQVFNSEQNAQELATDLDLIDELKDEAQIHEEACKLRASRRYNTRL